MEVRIQSDGGVATRIWLDGVEVTKRVRGVEFTQDEMRGRPACKVILNRVDNVGNPITEKGNILTEEFEPWMEKEEEHGKKGTATEANVGKNPSR